MSVDNMTVEERVKDVIAEHLNYSTADMKAESHLVNDLDADSLDVAEIVMGLEDEFDIEITDDTAAKFHTVGNIVEILSNVGTGAIA